MRERVRLTPNTPVTIPDIEARLEHVRRFGYALSDQDTVLGVRVVAAPILDPDGHPWASVSTAAPSFVCPLEEFVERSAQRVVEAGKSLSRILRVSGSTAVRMDSR
jgi:IclR family pca regulon transcriptional regulator